MNVNIESTYNGQYLKLRMGVGNISQHNVMTNASQKNNLTSTISYVGMGMA